ncbi:iron-hydroxamate ABC transporter substrate-binding protein [Virgibacillus salexigens]|uniref:iron-hydroxamate ABC transporter substrate-binding protein n=1 Tax=Virgibacillus TaxID=84406 RepID=UPI0013713CC4|nr:MULTISPECIES: iron-hydroxamate ABC transporter substrate-binding protein [Virgibacillus]MYL40011.1 ABC transporter substrate-binding protein [Virgibacillus massiliensis]
MKSKTLSNIILLVSFIGVLFLAACGSNESSENNEGNQEEKETSNNTEVIMQSEMGEVTIPANPENIIAPYHEDALLALGVTPVAKWAIGNSIQQYLEEDLKDVPKIEWNLPIEQVLSQEPDLIILENAIQNYEGSYEEYSKIAPTYVMSEETTKDWRKQIEVFGEMLGMQDKADQVLNDYDQKVEDASKELSNTIGDESAAIIWVMGDKFYLFEHNRHSAGVLYNELGIKQPALIEELGDATEEWNPISIEKLSELDADHVFLLAEEGQQGVETLKNSSVWQATKAAKNNHVYQINDPSNWTNKGLIASEKTIDDVLQALE